jgi:hypothetical protein
VSLALAYPLEREAEHSKSEFAGSKAKTVFLLTSMVGWLILGAALIDPFPVIFDSLICLD